jgi:hypothetical protein
MKQLFIISTILVMLAACQGKDEKPKLTTEEKEKAISDSASFTTITWLDSTTKNLGDLELGKSVDISYRFKNSGNKNLVFEMVDAPCGCTIPEKPEKPFAPGEEGEIKATFNGQGFGTIEKTIRVKTNTTPSTEQILTFKGNIINSALKPK